ncbi:hypothetical protein BBBOND_0312490 [Babesia bigemina]|uniref:Uncharacterized protein n=1 Tax=Babesia bigemina TaxID=5866 RepID=A0A061D9K0_BABBI|nr:hypothetical protein BBBOND_0312490 [Babesia bigemina]CDR97346.1 hypothetical protein BBBOND_0312490 [Babesia bigemina]|eukprot:XP_012769532.1 hypothetical protein BBBOND_0312490 [Babesia bigemina]
MKPLGYFVPQAIAALMFSWVTVFNESPISALPTNGDSGGEDHPLEGIAFYAEDEEFYRKVKILVTLTRPDGVLFGFFETLPSLLSASEATPEVKEAAIHECRQLLNAVQDVTGRYIYFADLKNILDKYRVVSRGLKRKNLTPELSAKLRSALENLTEQFKGNERTASGIFQFYNASKYRETIRQAQLFIQKYTGYTQTAPEHNIPGSSVRSRLNQAVNTADFVKNTGMIPSDVPQSYLSSDEGNETMRVLLNDREILQTLHEIQAMANKIEEILHEPLMNDINFYAAGSPPILNTELILKFQEHYDKLYDTLRDIRYAWPIHKRYNDINDMLKVIDPQSPQASELIREQRQLEISFEEYGPVVVTMSAKYVKLNTADILTMLEKIEKERKPAQLESTVPTASPQDTPPSSAAYVPKESTSLPQSKESSNTTAPTILSLGEGAGLPLTKERGETITTSKISKTICDEPSQMQNAQKPSITESGASGESSSEQPAEKIALRVNVINLYKRSSGFLTTAITVIRTMVAVGVIAVI